MAPPYMRVKVEKTGTKRKASTALVTVQPRRKYARTSDYGRINARSIISTIPRTVPTMGPMGHGRFARLRYVTILDPDTLGAASSHYIWRLNSCYDPNVTGTGHQPYGFDQMMQFFTRFIVFRSKMTIEMNNIPQDGYGSGLWGITVQDSSQTVPGSDFEANAEKPYTKYRLMPVGQYSNNGPQKISYKFDTARFYGVTQQAIMADPAYSGTAAADTSRQAYGIYWGGATDPDEDVYPQVTAVCTITYDVYFYQPVKLGQS